VIYNFILLLSQVGYHKMAGKNVATYESCSTAAFRHGRTETVRPCTVATQNVCLALNGSSKPSASEILSLIKKCSEMHGNLTKEAAMGKYTFKKFCLALYIYFLIELLIF
jgi:carnitine O-palmitoyltransferase 2